MKNRIIFFVFFILFFGTSYFFNANVVFNSYQKKLFKVSVELKTSEDDDFQLFYRDSLGKFSEKLSKRKRVVSSSSVQELIFEIPDSLSFSYFRFDIGNRKHTAPVIINKIKFSYNGNKLIIDTNEINNYFKFNRFIEYKNNSYYRKVINNQSDPIFSSINLKKKLDNLQNKINYEKYFLVVIASLLIAICLSYSLSFYFQSRKGNNYLSLFIIFFFLIIISPHFDELFFLDKTSILEKRVLTEKPKIELTTLEEFPIQFESYYNDNFGFRKKMISLNAILKVKLFKTSPKKEKVIVGKNGWLFYWVNTVKSSYTNEHPFLNENLGNYGKSIIKMKENFDDDNKIFITSIFPNKHTIYQGEIPNRFNELRKNSPSRMDQFYSFVNKNEINSVDNRNVFLTEKKNHVLYLKNDSHWNSFGAYYAYRNIINKISSLSLKVNKPIELNNFKITHIKDFEKGDLLNLMGIDNRSKIFKDDYFRFTNANSSFKRTVNVYGKNSVIVENNEPENDLTVLFFGDSYSYELIQFIPIHFKRTIFVRNIRFDKKLIREINPDIIIYGIVERNLENF
mgnify:CR=1 FL=1